MKTKPPEYRCVIIKTTKPKKLKAKTWRLPVPKLSFIENFSKP